MFLPTPEDIKKQRIMLNLTQNEIARRAGVSQPLIARIESGDVDPRLSTLKKIFKAFDEAKKERVPVTNIMHTPVVHTCSADSLDVAVKIMEEYGFSQVPVIDNGVPVGSVSSDTILKFMTDRDIKQIHHIPVRDIMGEPFPTVSPTSDTMTISHILEQNPAVLVLEKGKVIGVVTKHDAMKLLHG